MDRVYQARAEPGRRPAAEPEHRKLARPHRSEVHKQAVTSASPALALGTGGSAQLRGDGPPRIGPARDVIQLEPISEEVARRVRVTMNTEYHFGAADSGGARRISMDRYRRDGRITYNHVAELTVRQIEEQVFQQLVEGTYRRVPDRFVQGKVNFQVLLDCNIYKVGPLPPPTGQLAHVEQEDLQCVVLVDSERMTIFHFDFAYR